MMPRDPEATCFSTLRFDGPYPRRYPKDREVSRGSAENVLARPAGVIAARYDQICLQAHRDRSQLFGDARHRLAHVQDCRNVLLPEIAADIDTAERRATRGRCDHETTSTASLGALETAAPLLRPACMLVRAGALALGLCWRRRPGR